MNERSEKTATHPVASTDLLGYVVELEPGVWHVADLDGDPGRTLVLESATRFPTIRAAEKALNHCKTFRVFPNHNIRPIFAA